MEYLIKTKSKKTKKLIELLMESFIDQLKLRNSKKVVLVEVSRYSGKDNDGMTIPLPDLDSYIITLKPGTWHHMGITLAHEMVHVKQMAKGILKSENGKKYWRGKCYNTKVKYLDSPWELDAFSKQEILLRRALEVKPKRK